MDVDRENIGFSLDPLIVDCRYPQRATRLSMDELLRRKESAEGASADGRGPAQKQQKSFLQQNWPFLLAGALIVGRLSIWTSLLDETLFVQLFQIMGNVADPAAGQGNQGPGQVQGRR